LLRDLAAAGFPVRTVWDLVNARSPYTRALPILLNHLDKPYADRTLEGIARALAVKEARAIAWEAMLANLRSNDFKGDAASALVVAISAMARPEDLPRLIELIRDPSLGQKRIHLVRNLTRSRQKAARETLLHLRYDPDLEIEIAARLKRSAR